LKYFILSLAFLARGEDDEQILVEEEGIIVYNTFIYDEIGFFYMTVLVAEQVPVIK
jgi:hypothetical protein